MFLPSESFGPIEYKLGFRYTENNEKKSSLGVCGWTRDKLFHKVILDSTIHLIFNGSFIFLTERKPGNQTSR